MKKSFVLATITILLFGCTASYQSPQDVITKVRDNYNKHTSIAYQAYYRQKYFGEPDTFSLHADCKLVRDTSDRFFGGRVWFLTNDTIEKYSDLSNFYMVDRSTKKITACPASEENISLINGNISEGAIRVGFLNPGKLLDDVKDTANKLTLESDGDYFMVTIKYPDDSELSESKKTLRIRKNDFVIDKLTYTTRFQGNYQYDECNLSNIEFDKVATADLDKTMALYKQSYAPLQYPPPRFEVPILAVGSAAPFFRGADFFSGKEVTLNDYKGKFIILDFSYMSCYPCILAIPHLNKIQQAYKNKNVVVLCMNSKDNEEKYKKRLPDFISKNAMSYPVILTSDKTDSAYRVTGYPTLYAIDKKGKIVYALLGFAEGLEDSLKTVITRY